MLNLYLFLTLLNQILVKIFIDLQELAKERFDKHTNVVRNIK